MMPPQSSDGANLMRHHGKVVVVVAGYPILARGLTARFTWEHAGTPRAAEAQLPGGPHVNCPEITKEEAVTILAADPATDYG
jgi:hypothetical protein